MPNTLAYGFVGLEHLTAERVTTAGVDVVYRAVTESVQEHNRQIDELMTGFVQRTTDYKFNYALPTGGTLQPLDEYGNPRPVRPAGSFDVALPIRGGGTAWGDNRVTRALMTVEEANRFTLMVQSQDADWLRRQMLSAIFTNTAWTYDDPQWGSLTIQPLANNDAVTYNRVGGTTSADTHHLAQAGVISDAANPFPTIYDELMEHPSNSGPVVAYVASNLVSAIKGLTTFVEDDDPNVIRATNEARLAVTIDQGFGDMVLGAADRVQIVEWRALPDNYIIAHATGAGPVLGMREYPAPDLQGLFTEMHSLDGNVRENRFIRYAGFGVINRVAAVVYRIGNASYAIPTGYDAPLAV